MGTVMDLTQRTIELRASNGQCSYGPKEQLDNANFSESTRHVVLAGKPSFLEDYMFEHSLSDSHCTSTEI